MNLKTVLTGAAFAVALPFAASAATLNLVEGGAANTIDETTIGEVWGYQLDGNNSDDFDNTDLSFAFENDLDYVVSLEISATADILPDATASGNALGGFTNPPTTPIPDDGNQDFMTTLGAAGEDDSVTFYVRLGDVEPDYTLIIRAIATPAPIPVPAAGFLLLGGLGGLAMMRRRKKS